MATGEPSKVPAAPTCVEEFTKSWAEFVLGRWLAGQERGGEGLDVTNVHAVLNSQQVILSQEPNSFSGHLALMMNYFAKTFGHLFFIVSVSHMGINFGLINSPRHHQLVYI